MKLPPLHDRALPNQEPKRLVWVDDDMTEEEKTERETERRPTAEALSDGFNDSSEYSNEQEFI